jgi:thiol:disulfide interchange protein DsbC
MKLRSMSLLLAALLLSSQTFAVEKTKASLNAAEQKRALQLHLIEKTEKHIGLGQVVSITETKYGGLYEVRGKQGIVYTDKKGDFLFMGKIIDTVSGSDVTQERENELNKIDFKTLPLDLAIKTVFGNGKRVIAIFEDPNCGFCIKNYATIMALKDVTIYSFQYNILSPDSITKSANVWCAEDRSKAWADLLGSKKLPDNPIANCATPHNEVLALGKKLKVNGTPTIFFTDGTRVPGWMPVEKYEEKFAKVKM